MQAFSLLKSSLRTTFSEFDYSHSTVTIVVAAVFCYEILEEAQEPIWPGNW